MGVPLSYPQVLVECYMCIGVYYSMNMIFIYILYAYDMPQVAYVLMHSSVVCFTIHV